MTRREEIVKAANEFYKGDEVSTFVVAAQWADRAMIAKVREYLRCHMYNTPIFEHDEDENPVNYVCASCCDSVEEFIENICKSMEE